MTKSNKIEDLHGNHFVQARTILVALGADEETAIFRHSGSKSIKVTGVQWIPDTAVTGLVTNNMIIGIVNKGLAGVGTVAVTDLKTYGDTVDSVKFVGEALTLSSTAASLIVLAGEVLSLDKTENGTGMLLPPGIVEISYEYI